MTLAMDRTGIAMPRLLLSTYSKRSTDELEARRMLMR